MMATTFKDYYSALDVPRNASQKEIKAAFRKLARKHHPDVNPGDSSAEAKFKEINEAHEVLGDPKKREKYDQLGPDSNRYEAWANAGRPGPNPFGGPQVEYRTVSPQELEQMFGGADPFSDFFHDIFGRSQPGRRAVQALSRRGGDIEGEAVITLEEAYSGAVRTLEVSTPTGIRRVQVKIPAGISDGARVRASGQGGAGAGGGNAGDLFLRVRIEPHPSFTRQGDNLRVKVPVPLNVALAGGQVEVPTPKGTRVSVRVSPETQNGRLLRLRGLGMPKLKGEGKGDLVAEVSVQLPSPPDPALMEWAKGRAGGKA